MSDRLTPGNHVEELLSGFIDGELTQQERQRVRLHCESCSECESNLAELRAMRKKVGAAQLSDRDQDSWREAMNDTATRTARGLGWLLLIGGALLAVGVGLYEFVLSLPTLGTMEKLIVIGIYGGLLLIFGSVVRQRLIERKTDKYKDVEI